MQIEQAIITRIADAIAAYGAVWPNEQTALAPLRRQLTAAPSGLFNRKTTPGHITASGIVFCRGKLLMVFHPYLQRLLQPGGHVEKGETPAQAAIREVEEETGFVTQLHPWHKANPMPFDIDIHRIAANEQKAEPSHLHYDFRYVLTVAAEPKAKAAKTPELSFLWQPIAAVKEDNLQRCARKFRLYGQ